MALGVDPSRLRNGSLKTGIPVQIVMLADIAAVLKHFRGIRVSMLRRVIQLLKEREINVRFDVAHRARISIPVPRPTKIACFVDYANIFKTGLTKASASQKTAKSGTCNDHVCMLADGRSR